MADEPPSPIKVTAIEEPRGVATSNRQLQSVQLYAQQLIVRIRYWIVALPFRVSKQNFPVFEKAGPEKGSTGCADARSLAAAAKLFPPP
jgi:hypothetical protein